MSFPLGWVEDFKQKKPRQNRRFGAKKSKTTLTWQRSPRYPWAPFPQRLCDAMSLFPRHHRALTAIVSEPAFCRTAAALGLQAKNFKNSAVFIIRQALFALKADGTLKPDALPDQISLIAVANQAVLDTNAMRQGNLDRAWEEKGGEPGKGPRVSTDDTLKLFLAPESEKRARPWQILDASLLNRLAREHVDQDGFRVFDSLPPAVAYKQVALAIQSFQDSFKAKAAHAKDLAKPKSQRKFTGQPKLPGFMEKNARATLVFPGAASFGLKKGLFRPDQALRFRELKFTDPKKEDTGGAAASGARYPIHADYEKNQFLSAADMDAFAAFPLDHEWRAIKAQNHIPEDVQLTEIRIVALRSGKVKIEFCVAWDAKLKKSSFIERMFKKLEAVDPEMKESDFNTELLKILQAMKRAQLPIMAGSDPGVNNLISFAVTDGNEAIVISGKRLENRVGFFDRRIDQRKSELTPPEVKAIMQKRDANIAAREARELAEEQKAAAEKAAREAEHGALNRRVRRLGSQARAAREAKNTRAGPIAGSTQIIAPGLARTGPLMGERESLRAPEAPVWLTGDFPAALAPNPRNAADASGGFGAIDADGEAREFEALESFVAAAAAAGHEAACPRELHERIQALLAERLAEEALAQARDDARGNLTPAELATLRHRLSEIHKDPELLRLMARREAFVENFLHQASRGAVNALAKRGVELIVIGHNPLWKHESEMNRKQNRRFHLFPHARLFHMLRYKALAMGILAVEVEESYTSKTSFVKNAALRAFGEKKAQASLERAAQKAARQAEEAKSTASSLLNSGAFLATATDRIEPTTGETLPAGTISPKEKAIAEFGGIRGEGENRGVYTTPDAPLAWRDLHSDVNGAFNILRKACPAFEWRKGLSMGFKIHWVSPKDGLTAMNLGREKRA